MCDSEMPSFSNILLDGNFTLDGHKLGIKIPIERLKKRLQIQRPIRRKEVGGNSYSANTILLFGHQGNGEDVVISTATDLSSAHQFIIDCQTLIEDNYETAFVKISKIFKQATAATTPGAVVLIANAELAFWSKIHGFSKPGLLQVLRFFLKGVNRKPINTVSIIAFISKPWLVLDSDLKLFYKKICIPLPNKKAKAHLFELYLNEVCAKRGISHSLNYQDFTNLSVSPYCVNSTWRDFQHLCYTAFSTAFVRATGSKDASLARKEANLKLVTIGVVDVHQAVVRLNLSEKRSSDVAKMQCFISTLKSSERTLITFSEGKFVARRNISDQYEHNQNGKLRLQFSKQFLKFLELF